MLKLSWFGCGLRMEVCFDGQRIVTSPVQSIEVQRDVTPGPFWLVSYPVNLTWP